MKTQNLSEPSLNSQFGKNTFQLNILLNSAIIVMLQAEEAILKRSQSFYFLFLAITVLLTAALFWYQVQF